MKLDCLRSLPCLREFRGLADFLPNEIAEVIKRVQNLKRITLLGRTNRKSWELGSFPSCLSVEELIFDEFQSANLLLLFPLPRLRSLKLFAMRNVPLVPTQACTGLRRVEWMGDFADYDLGRLLKKNLLGAPELHCLVLKYCSLKAMLELGVGDKFQTLQTLGLGLEIDEPGRQLFDYSRWIAPAPSRGCFPALRYLEVWIYAYSFPEAAPSLKDLEPVFRVCEATLKKFHICTQNFVFTEDDVAMLRSLNWSKNLNMRVTMEDSFHGGYLYGRIHTMANIAKLPLLTTLTLLHARICNIEELFAHPRLKRVSFYSCLFEASEMQGLEERWTSLETLVFNACEQITGQQGRTFFEQNPHLYPFPALTMEHRGY